MRVFQYLKGKFPLPVQKALRVSFNAEVIVYLQCGLTK